MKEYKKPKEYKQLSDKQMVLLIKRHGYMPELYSLNQRVTTSPLSGLSRTHNALSVLRFNSWVQRFNTSPVKCVLEFMRVERITNKRLKESNRRRKRKIRRL